MVGGCVKQVTVNGLEAVIQEVVAVPCQYSLILSPGFKLRLLKVNVVAVAVCEAT